MSLSSKDETDCFEFSITLCHLTLCETAFCSDSRSDNSIVPVIQSGNNGCHTCIIDTSVIFIILVLLLSRPRTVSNKTRFQMVSQFSPDLEELCYSHYRTLSLEVQKSVLLLNDTSKGLGANPIEVLDFAYLTSRNVLNPRTRADKYNLCEEAPLRKLNQRTPVALHKMASRWALLIEPPHK